MVKQQLSVHSEDRDISKWPNSNLFEVELPVDYKNVSSMRLIDIDIPANFHVFSVVNQNNRLLFKLRGHSIIIQITEGTYRPNQMALELAGQMNAAASAVLLVPYTSFTVVHNDVSQKFLFVNSLDTFELDFTCSQFDGTYFENYGAWGLGYNLGFSKRIYTAVQATTAFYWKNATYTGWTVDPPNTFDMFADTQVYMEVFLFNSMDEIMPYTERSSSLYTSKQGGKHNSAFAKIPLEGRHCHQGDTYGHEFNNRHNLVTNVFWSEPPLERIQKLKFKFRFHDGRLVHFGTDEFSFVIELTLERTDVPKFAHKKAPLGAQEEY
jgi:hypothetical protein